MTVRMRAVCLCSARLPADGGHNHRQIHRHRLCGVREENDHSMRHACLRDCMPLPIQSHWHSTRMLHLRPKRRPNMKGVLAVSLPQAVWCGRMARQRDMHM
eukprot:1159079-Pelagomonas_calceolata.AAC.7